MMIWFAVILHVQDTCCIKTNENKTTTKKTLSCEWCLLHNFTHSLTLCHMHQTVCFTTNTQMTNFLFQALVRRRSLFFNLFGLYLYFFSWVIGNTSFWARPYKIAQAFLPAHGLLFWHAFLKKRMAPLSWKPEGIAKCRLEICNWVVRN